MSQRDSHIRISTLHAAHPCHTESGIVYDGDEAKIFIRTTIEKTGQQTTLFMTSEIAKDVSKRLADWAAMAEVHEEKNR